MSTLRLTTISNQGGTASVPSATVISGTAKAWINFNGTGTVAIRGSFNVSSVTDNGTGDYTINFTNAMPDVNFTAVCAPNDWRTFGVYEPYSSAITTGSVRVTNRMPNTAALNDHEFMGVAVFR